MQTGSGTWPQTGKPQRLTSVAASIVIRRNLALLLRCVLALSLARPVPRVAQLCHAAARLPSSRQFRCSVPSSSTPDHCIEPRASNETRKEACPAGTEEQRLYAHTRQVPRRAGLVMPPHPNAEVHRTRSCLLTRDPAPSVASPPAPRRRRRAGRGECALHLPACKSMDSMWIPISNSKPRAQAADPTRKQQTHML